MKKIKPLGKRVLVTSRGIKEEAGNLVIPKKFLRNSNVCTTESGETVIVKDMAGVELPNNQRIVKESEIIASVVGDTIVPIGEYVLVRKCLDVEETIITSTTGNKTQFAEILAAGDKTVLKNDIGKLAYVEHTEHDLQKIEESGADWLIKESAITMVVDPEG